MFLTRYLCTAVLTAVAMLSIATPASAEDASLDVSPVLTATICAKMARASESGVWTVGKNPGLLFSVARTRTFNLAPKSAPEWVRDVINGVSLQTSVVVSANNGAVEARCYYRNAASAWRQMGTAVVPGRLNATRPTFAPLLTSAECGTLLSTVASTNAWKPQRLSTGAARSVSRSFVGLEDFWNNSSLKSAAESTTTTPIRLEGVNSYFVINAIEEDAANVSARCFVFDQTLSTWLYAGATIGQVSITLPKAT
jgi:hypothetical protein